MGSAHGRAAAAVMALLLALFVLPFAGGGAVSAPAHPRPVSLGRAARPSGVALLMLENRSYAQVIGNPTAPYLNSLARHGALATRYYALTHPSLPNYVALTTGGHKHVGSDCAHCVNGDRSIVNQLDAAGISWGAYFENLPQRSNAPYSRTALYNRHYNPFVYESSALRPAAMSGAVHGFTALGLALATRRLPRFTWIAPNTHHDGHSGSLAAVDRFASKLVPRAVRALGPRGVLFITWDEGRRADHTGPHGSGGGHVALIATGPGAAHGARLGAPANHYALLKTIEGCFGLRPLGHAASSSTPVLSGLLRSGGVRPRIASSH